MDSSARRRAHGLLLLALFGTIVAAAFPAFSPTVYAADVSSASVLAAARAAITAQTGVHVVFTAHAGSTGTTEKIIADVGTTSGTETIFEGSDDVAIKVTPTFAYVSGNSSGLTKLFGMSAADAKKLGTRWEAWKVGAKQYTNLKSDVTMMSVADLLPKPKGTEAVAGTHQGHMSYLLSWTTPATSLVPKLSNRLVISAEDPTLPSSQSTTASGSTSITTRLSKWGEVVSVQAPPTDRTVSSNHLGS